MTHRVRLVWCALLVVIELAIPGAAHAAGDSSETQTTVVCGSKPGERQTCAANTTAGVTLVRSLGSVACELGRTWGYDAEGVWVSDGCGAEFSVAAPIPTTFGRYTPAVGFKVADTEHGDLNIRVFTYLRYLNQQRVDDTYTNAFGRTSDVQQRQDLQLNKLQIYFFGWIMNPRLRYVTYVWTSNTSLGQTSQVVVAGNLSYRFSDYLTVGGGVTGLPGVRSMEGTFPFWLSVDSRLIGDEFVRPSYTTALFADGRIAKGLEYRLAWGNNLSQFGIDAGQLDGGLDTIAGALVWMPTTGEFGRASGFGDFDRHDRLATRFALHLTRSDETRQAQPNTDAFDNVQIRVSDGSVIFAPALFAPDVQIEEATYNLFAVDAGLKYRGYSFDAEYYRRRIDNFSVRGTGALPFDALRDSAFSLQASAMAVPEQMQLYAGASKVFGEYGDPHDFRAGATFFPWKNQVVRWNFEYIQLNRSPVGSQTLPFAVGSNGPVFHSNFMLWF